MNNDGTFKILADYIKEFIPANKGHVLSLGVGLILMGICLVITAHSSGLHGDLTYLALHPGVTGPAIGGGVLLILAALGMKLPPEE